MPWYSSWLPDLPNFNFSIPTSIQGRFLSFILKKSLGHFLKPGQLDHHQIDSQLGSGYVQVTDLELNRETINTYLDGLPIALTSGTISSIKARIPWPNPLATSLGFSLKSLHLVFRVVPYTQPVNMPDVDLSESVASVAESFIHQELSPGEEATLWRSLHQDAPQMNDDTDQSVPGGLGDSVTVDGTARMFDQDPAGVSVFANLIERLLARFEFDADDIKITLIHPANVSLSMSVEELRYHTDGNSSPSSSQARGETRTVYVGGFSLSAQGLDSQKSFLHTTSNSPRSSPLSIATSRPLSRTSSSSSMDEATQFMMSQSLAALPSSPLCLLYESAISTAAVPSGQKDTVISPLSPTSPKEQSESQDINSNNAKFLSIETQPILVYLTTPSPVARASEDDNPFIPQADADVRAEDELQFSISAGVVALSAQPWQIRALTRLCKAMLPPEDKLQGASQLREFSAAKLPTIKLDVQLRGIVALFLTQTTMDNNAAATSLLDFFKKPLVPPLLQVGYTRLHLDALSGSLTVIRRDQKHDNTSASLVQSLDISVADFSLFFFKKAELLNTDATPGLSAFPLLHTDPYLLSQYPPPDQQRKSGVLPAFEIIDWTDEKCQNYGSKLSQWRCRPAKGSHSKSHSDSQGDPSTVEVNPSLVIGRPSLRISGRQYIDRRDCVEISENFDIHVAPLNLRFDFGYLLQNGGPLAFLEELIPFEIQDDDQISQSSQETVDTSFPAWDTGGKGIPMTAQSDYLEKSKYISENLCPPPPSEIKDRSGILVFDLHGITLSSGKNPPKVTSFSNGSDSPSRSLDLSQRSIILSAEFNRAVIACSMVGVTTANIFASVGPLQMEEPIESITQEFLNSNSLYSLPPRIQIVRPNARSSKAPLFALSVDIPAIDIHISKSEFDALQYLADDVSQLLERLSNLSNNAVQREFTNSRDASIIGSRFFVKSRSGSGSALSGGSDERAETVVKLTVTSAFFKVVVPRTDTEIRESRPFELKASDLDILVEFNPDGKQQTILTLGVMDLTIVNLDPQMRSQNFLSLTSPRSLSSAPKPIVKLRLSTFTFPGLNTKETRMKLTLSGITYNFFADFHWISDMIAFLKNPPGTFESVIPSDRTHISVNLLDVSIRLFAPNNSGSVVSYVQELRFSTDVEGGSQTSSFRVMAVALTLLAIDDSQSQEMLSDPANPTKGLSVWTAAGYALLTEVSDLDMDIVKQVDQNPSLKVIISRIILRLHLCADTLGAVTNFFGDFSSLFKNPDEVPSKSARGPEVINQRPSEEGSSLISSVEDLAFKKVPEVGPAPDMIYDDLPSNLDYLDESFGAAAGLRELRDDDLDEFDAHEVETGSNDDPNIVSKVGGETIKVFEPQGLEVVENYFMSIPPDTSRGLSYTGKPDLSVQILDGNFTLFLYDGYDWVKTRKIIEEEVKEMRKRLAKIRQLVATGQMQDATVEDTSALLFNSVYIGLDQDEDILGEPAALIAAIDEELKEDLETASQSSWQSLRPPSNGKPRVRPTRLHGKRLTRPKAPSMEFCLQGLQMEFDKYQVDDPLVSRTFLTVRDLEILDHIKTSTWKKFLTELRSDSRGNVRETESNMVRIELHGVRPVPGHSSEEARLRAKILPLRLYVDQDAVDFLKNFFGFKDPNSSPTDSSSSEGEAYIQMAEIFPVDLKLDYKPRRVDYRALKEGRTIELMNFFHFDGAEMTLRHITLAGVTGWGRFFEMLNDLWTPDVKATQLVEVISGVAPIRSMVNVGSGVADLILLPINQYKKDGRIVRGMQKGATAFIKSTAIEAIKMGAKLATGTQVILEQAEGVLGGRFEAPITAEPVQVPFGDELISDEEREENADLISKYARQPANLREGVQSAYKSLQKNFSSAAQTILAVPMEVYERSGNEGPVRSVIRAVPIAVLKPMIGTSEAVSKTLLGLHNTLDPNARHENEAKYKLR
ncbi:hypothetical protein CPB84DRAFT_1821154 [Gymnopilus junonius]|uniref:Autophagy-related protein 2 n=1 Tax=Gymnopilus junonius TaxID=109634 RepID=A0A9P5NWG6_GYMJU|nr:hypothetical protein CPB84DRAFT_1821154 [Gymnopilus junonius]